MRMGAEVELAPTAVADMRVELGRREVGVAEHLLDASEVCATLEQVRRERMPEQVGMNSLRLEPGFLREPPQDEENAGPGQTAALRVQEELGAVPAVEVGPSPGQVAAGGHFRPATQGAQPLLWFP